MLRTTSAAAAAAMILAAVVGSAQAVDRGKICHQQAAVVAPQYYPLAAPLYQYQVGQQIREEAIADRVAALVLEKLAAHPSKTQAAPQQTPPAENATLTAAQSLANQRCTTCHRHNGTDPDGADLRNLANLSALQGWSAFRHVYLGSMPKNGEPLADDEVETMMRWNVYRQQ